MHWDVVVIGAGAAGLLAATHAAERGRRTLLLEKNRKPGVKILMSGGTRCNLTHNTDKRGIVAAFGNQGKFLHSALAALNPQEVVKYVEDEGVATKVEPNGKIFPVSNRAVDIVDALLARLQRSGATLSLQEPLQTFEPTADGFTLTTSVQTHTASKVILTTGGLSYPGCGTTGDGYRWAAQLGHTVVPTRPALVPITVASNWVAPLKGITIPDVILQVCQPTEPGRADDVLLRTRGSFLLAHFGLSGPVVLDASRAVSSHATPRSLHLLCDLLPNMTPDALREFWKAQATNAGRKQILHCLPGDMPQRLNETLLQLADVAPDRKTAELSKAERARLEEQFKRCRLPVTGTLGYGKAEVTAGGVSLDEVDSKTLQSKKLPNLYLAGEVLDLDGPIGGYNFQAAFSTGWLAGKSV